MCVIIEDVHQFVGHFLIPLDPCIRILNLSLCCTEYENHVLQSNILIIYLDIELICVCLFYYKEQLCRLQTYIANRKNRPAFFSVVIKEKIASF